MPTCITVQIDQVLGVPVTALQTAQSHTGQTLQCTDMTMRHRYDPNGRPPRGEICIRGPLLFKEYYKDDKKTEEAMGEAESQADLLCMPCGTEVEVNSMV